jgi:hypothetical protein
MALDRFVYFEQRVPTPQHVRQILVNFLGGCGTVEDGPLNWWVITLPGKCSSPFAGIPGSRPFHPDRYNGEERWIEVVFQPDDTPSVDVMTRHADEFTNGVAERLAQEFARFYGGRLEQG